MIAGLAALVMAGAGGALVAGGSPLASYLGGVLLVLSFGALCEIVYRERCRAVDDAQLLLRDRRAELDLREACLRRREVQAFCEQQQRASVSDDVLRRN